MSWHHHHVGDLEMTEHFDIEDPDPTDVIHDDNIVVHSHAESHYLGMEPCEYGCIVFAGAVV